MTSPMFKTITLASIYELQGFKNEAIEIYQEILKSNPKNTEARLALKRLNAPKQMLKLTQKLNFDEKQIEEWLTAWN